MTLADVHEPPRKQTRAEARLFHAGCALLMAAGFITIYLTLLPGWTPFHAYYNDPGLGGMAFFFFWPLNILQIAVASILKRSYADSRPMRAWAFLSIALWIGLHIDYTAIHFVYS
jgi:hypothetical protein